MPKILLVSVVLTLTLTFSPVANSAAPQTLIEDAKRTVKDILKDPASAQFKNVKINSMGDVCGLFNAKNSLGGYGEFEPFRYEAKTKSLINNKVAQLEAEIEQDKQRRRETGFDDPGFVKFEQMREKIKVKWNIVAKIEGCHLE